LGIDRREFMQWLSAAAITGSAGCAISRRAGHNVGRVVVIGAGFGGATAAKYIRMWSPDIDVTLVEPNQRFISCPMSNRVLAGTWQLADITCSYDGLAAYGVNVVHDLAIDVDPVGQVVTLASGRQLPYERLIVSPGIELVYQDIPGLHDPASRDAIPHAWKAGEQTAILRRQLEDMKDGGVYAITVPLSPYRCPPGPYERACLVAQYFSNYKPRSKVLVLDANADIQSKKALFSDAWQKLYPGIVEYHANESLVDVDVTTRTAILDFEDIRADVLNVVPPQRAGRIARDAGLITANDSWCEVDFVSYESIAVGNVHVLGDAVMGAPRMPKSGHMANQHGKVCAAAVIAMLHGDSPNGAPLITNTCYSYVSDKAAMHIASVHEYDNEQRTMLPIEGAGGLSEVANEVEGRIAESWAHNIWNDVLG
jgi:sulfide dehydrogenase [flavocytochrome c] flavoprotein subunit